MLRKFLVRIATRVADSFATKMRVNAFVIDEVAKAISAGAPDEAAFNEAAMNMLESPIHDAIADFSVALQKEIDRQKSLHRDQVA